MWWEMNIRVIKYGSLVDLCLTVLYRMGSNSPAVESKKKWYLEQRPINDFEFLRKSIVKIQVGTRALKGTFDLSPGVFGKFYE